MLLSRDNYYITSLLDGIEPENTFYRRGLVCRGSLFCSGPFAFLLWNLWKVPSTLRYSSGDCYHGKYPPCMEF